MDVAMAKAWYDGPWQQVDGGVHPKCDPANPASREVVKRIEKQLRAQIQPGDRVLDLGCNAGRFCFAMEEMGAIPTGIDCATYPLNYARQLAGQRGSKCTFVEGNLFNLPFEENSFELAVFPSNIVEATYEEMDSLAAQLRRILVPGGRLCMEMMDEFLFRSGDEAFLRRYEAATGLVQGMCQCPGYEPVPLMTTFWTVGFAKHLIGQHLKLIHEEHLIDCRYWLVFENA